MNKYLIIISIALLIPNIKVYGQTNYMDYHKEVIKCEQLIVEGKFKDAIVNFDLLFNHQFDFVFLRECKLATELSVYEQDSKSAFRFLRTGIKQGWALKDINKNKNLRSLKKDSQWLKIVSEYDSIHNIYSSKLNNPLRKEIREMFKKDQKKALGALFRIGQKAQNKYTEKKFAPHSEKQLGLLNSILKQYGYPGEQLIGNSLWVSVILSHHNSISRNYNSKDTLYTQLRPKLMEALKRGEISPYELAQIEDWRTAGLSGHELTSFGFIGKIPSSKELKTVNKNRAEIGMRSIELRNNLIDIEKSTGLNLSLPKGWQNGKITVANKRQAQ